MPNSKPHKAVTIFMTNVAMERMINEWGKCDTETGLLPKKNFIVMNLFYQKQKLKKRHMVLLLLWIVKNDDYIDSGDTALFIICDEPLAICKSHWGFKVIEWFIYKKNNRRHIAHKYYVTTLEIPPLKSDFKILLYMFTSFSKKT